MEFTGQAHNFLKSINFDKKNVGQNNELKIGTSDQTFMGVGVQTLNYTLMYEVTFLPTENGTDLVNATSILRVDSLCTKVRISNVSVPLSYFVRSA